MTNFEELNRAQKVQFLRNDCNATALILAGGNRDIERLIDWLRLLAERIGSLDEPQPKDHSPFVRLDRCLDDFEKQLNTLVFSDHKGVKLLDVDGVVFTLDRTSAGWTVFANEKAIRSSTLKTKVLFLHNARDILEAAIAVNADFIEGIQAACDAWEKR